MPLVFNDAIRARTITMRVVVDGGKRWLWLLLA